MTLSQTITLQDLKDYFTTRNAAFKIKNISLISNKTNDRTLHFRKKLDKMQNGSKRDTPRDMTVRM